MVGLRSTWHQKLGLCRVRGWGPEHVLGDGVGEGEFLGAGGWGPGTKQELDLPKGLFPFVVRQKQKGSS